MTKILLALIRFVLGRYAPKWAAALEGGQAAYQAADQQEQDQAVTAKEAELRQVQAETAARKDEAHAKVAAAADPNAAVNQQLHDLGIITDD